MSENLEKLRVRKGLDLESLGSASILVVRAWGSPAERIFVRSEAVLLILRELPRPWPAVALVLGWIPRPVRDLGYRMIARWRYRLWGRVESCALPSEGDRARFL